MFATRFWTRFALACNLIGAVLLLLSFQATSSDLKLFNVKDEKTMLCANGNVVLAATPMTLSVGGPCKEWENAKPIALVAIEHPWLVYAGFLLTLLGFLIQWLAVPGDAKL